jgi:hypothetical protein
VSNFVRDGDLHVAIIPESAAVSPVNRGRA